MNRARYTLALALAAGIGVFAPRPAVSQAAALTALHSSPGRMQRGPAAAARLREPPPARFTADSADSLYRAAREALNSGDYRRASRLFQRITDEFPRSDYAADALYWQAFALYRSGEGADLRAAQHALELQQERFPRAATAGDARELLTRISGELARTGDADAAAQVARAAHAPPCSGDDDMKAAAMNALQQMDPEQAMPILEQVLARRDDCSAKLRRKAVFLVANQDAPQAADILLRVIHDDPDAQVRQDAVWWLSQVHGDRAVAVLDSIVHNSTDEAMVDRAVQALGQQDDARAQQALRDLVRRTDVPERVRSRAIFAIGNGDHSAESASFLRSLWTTLDSPRLKEQLLQSMSSVGDSAAQQWLVDIALDPKEDMELRKKALFWAGNAEHSTPTLLSLYDRLKEPELRKQMIFVYSNSDNAKAVDKLIDIARTDPDVEMRKQAIFWLGQKDDPRVKQLLLEIINR